MNDELKLIAAHLDKEFYLSQCPQARHSALSPAEHYLRIGGFTGYNPNRKFSSSAYWFSNPDVAAAQVNPYLHFLRYGKAEGRPIGNPAFVPDEGERKPLLLLNFLRPLPWAQTEKLLNRLGNTIHAYSMRQIAVEEEADDDPLAELADANPPALGKDPGADAAFLAHLETQRRGRILSLDIWDTLLRRRCDPDEVKLRAARTLWLRGRAAAPHLAALHPVDVMQARRMAETLQANDAGEYRLGEAATLWLEMLQLTEAFTPEELVQIDLDVEKDVSYPDPTIAALLKKTKERVICVSDFYHGGEGLTALLQHHKLDQVEQVYASSDHLLTKRDGTLFDVVLKTEECEPDALFHVGDRAEADVTMPRQRGIDAEQYTNLWHDAAAKAGHKRFWSHVAGDSTLHEDALMEALKLPAIQGKDPLPLAAMGLVVAGFGMRIIEDATRHGVSKTFFCTREGVFFRAVYDALVKQDVFELGTYPASDTLHVSRRATFGPSLKSFTMTELMRLWNQYAKQSLRVLATTLNIDAKDWKPFAQAEDIDVDEVIHRPWEDPRVQRLMRNQAFIDSVRTTLWAKRTDAQAYLKGMGLGKKPDGEMMMVDIGWRGTIQDSLSELLRGDIHGSYLGLDFFINRQPANTTKSAYLFDRNHSFDFAVHEYSALEFLFNSPGGSVIGYEDGKPITEISEREESVITGPVAGFQAKILATLPTIARYVRDHGLVSQDLQQLSRRIVRSYMANPPADVAKAFADLDHNETFGTGQFDDMSGSEEYLLKTFNSSGADLHNGLITAAKNVRWVEALLSLKKVNTALKKLPLDAKMHLPTTLFAPHALRGSAGTQPQIAITAPMPLIGSGGHRTIYNMARRLSELGADVHMLSERAGAPDAVEWMEEITQDADFTHHSRWNAPIKPDAAIATIAHSAPFVKKRFGGRAETFYFVQDHEAEFNPVSDGYLRAQTTFTQTDNHLTIGSWLSHMLATQYGRPAAAGGLGVDHTIYGPVKLKTPKGKPVQYKDVIRKKQVAFLYQPEKWRRAPEMCISALAQVKQRLPEVEVVLYGSDRTVDVPFEADHRGLITELSELNEIYNESRVGLCISATNPSRIPFEMMAAGCVPVDLYRYNNLFDYASGTGMLAYQTPESIAEAICQLMEDDTLADTRAEAGRDYVLPRTLDWETDVAANAVNHVLSGGTLDDLPPPLRSYHDAPVVSGDCDSLATQRFLEWQAKLADSK